MRYFMTHIRTHMYRRDPASLPTEKIDGPEGSTGEDADSEVSIPVFEIPDDAEVSALIAMRDDSREERRRRVAVTESKADRGLIFV